jgi:Kef-type K+ transport system membrane component KefB/mannitol/fructose-specific phosphotransferase system IIA component (Ntr-type)
LHVLSEHTVFIFVAQLGIILLFARILGEIFVRLGQPIIVGEVVAGIFLGPAIFGYFFPGGYMFLFPQIGEQPYLLQAISWLCVIFLLLITGLEIDFNSALKQGKHSVIISLIALASTFGVTYFSAQYLPDYLFPADIDPVHVRLFVAIALAVVAIPVIAKILFDLKILRSEVGLNILTTGVVSDVWGWSVLAVIVSLIAQGNLTVLTIIKPIFAMIAYVYLAHRYGALIVNKIFNLLGYEKLDTTAVLSILFGLALLNGAIAHLIGIHVIFGAFISGIMAGESEKITPYIRQWVQDFIFGVFAPIFFVLIGMQLKVSRPESLIPIFALLIITSVVKISAAYVGGIIGGLGKKNAFAIACGLNTQGTMGIIVALIGYEMGVFNEEMFSVIVIICVLTSLFVGPLLKWAIRGVQRPLAKFFDQEHVFLDIEGTTKEEIVDNMARLLFERKIVDNELELRNAVFERELTFSTAIGEGIALPHARMLSVTEPILCFFRLKNAVDYNSPDNKPVQLLFLELTADNDDGMHLNLMSQVTRFVSKADNREKLLNCTKEEEVHSIMSFDEKA